MGDETVSFLNALELPLAAPLERGSAVQHLTPTIDVLVVPAIEDSLDDQASKRAFWDAFRASASGTRRCRRTEGSGSAGSRDVRRAALPVGVQDVRIAQVAVDSSTSVGLRGARGHRRRTRPCDPNFTRESSMIAAKREATGALTTASRSTLVARSAVQHDGYRATHRRQLYPARPGVTPQPVPSTGTHSAPPADPCPELAARRVRPRPRGAIGRPTRDAREPRPVRPPGAACGCVIRQSPPRRTGRAFATVETHARRAFTWRGHQAPVHGSRELRRHALSASRARTSPRTPRAACAGTGRTASPRSAGSPASSSSLPLPASVVGLHDTYTRRLG